MKGKLACDCTKSLLIREYCDRDFPPLKCGHQIAVINKVRGGEILVAPEPGQNPKRVRGGLIHHWIGAMLVPHVKLDDILEVTRDYDRYKEFYRPSVVASKMIVKRVGQA